MLTYKQEKFKDIVRDIATLWVDHWEEIAGNKDKIPLDPDVEKYLMMDEQGGLLCVAVRDEEALVGYSFMIIGPHLHYKSTIFAYNDLLYLKPEYRRGMTGIKLIKITEALCKMAGTTKILWHIKTDHDFGPIMTRLGYTDFESIYSKYIGE